MIASPLRSRASWTWRTISFHLDFDVVIVFHILIPVFLVGSRIPKEGNQFHRHLAQRQSQTKSDVQPLFSLLNQKSQKKKKNPDSKSSERDGKGDGNCSSWRTFEPTGPRHTVSECTSKACWVPVSTLGKTTNRAESRGAQSSVRLCCQCFSSLLSGP